MNASWQTIEFLTTLFEFLLLEYLASRQLIKNKTKNTKSKIFILMIMVTTMYLLTVFHIGFWLKIIIGAPLFIAYVFNFYQGGRGIKLFVAAAGYLAMFIADCAVLFIFSVIIGANYLAIANTQDVTRLTFIIVAKVIHFFIIFLASKYKKIDCSFFKNRKLIVTLSLVTLAVMGAMWGLCHLIYTQADIQSISVITLSLSSIIITYVFSCIMFLSFAESSNKLVLSYVQTQRLADDVAAIELHEISDNRIKAILHEYKNRLATMSLYWNSNQQDMLGTTIAEGMKQYELADFKSYGNSVVDNTINIRRWQALSRNIAFKAVGKFEDDLEITVDELCSVLGNLLDNAIEATSTIENPDNKWIEIETKRNVEKMYITVSNYCEKKFKKNTTRIPTTKKDADMHGFGLMIIREIVDKYNGDFSFEVIDNVFTAKVVLDGHKQD